MPEQLLRIGPLLYLLYAAGALLVHRARMAKRLGRDPVVVAPFRERDLPFRYLELVLVLCTLAGAADAVLNALASDWVARQLAIPMLRAATALRWLGLAVMGAGMAVSSLAVLQMGTSWRMGIDREPGVRLATEGLYGRIRHPIYSGVLLITAGQAAVTGNLLSIVVVTTAWACLPVQARLEEQHLLSVHGDLYQAYLARTRRFWPLGRVRTSVVSAALPR